MNLPDVLYKRIYTHREVNVHLECDKDLKDPIVTTSGDNVSIFTYVSYKTNMYAVQKFKTIAVS